VTTASRLGGAVVLAVLAGVGAAAAQTTPVKIGLLLPYTGVLSVQGTDTTHGIEVALARAGGKAGGRAIELVREDTEGKPDVGLTKVKKLIERDRVDVVIGPVNSAVAIAIRNYVHEQGVPLVVPVAATKVLMVPPLASPWIFRMTENSDQTNYPFGGWLIKHTPYRRMIVMGTDFVAGRDSTAAFMAGFRAAGGEVVKEIYAPLGTPDFAPHLSQAAAVQADAVFGWFPGADAVRFVKQYGEYGLQERLPLVGHNVLADDTILPAIGDTALGLVTIGSYTATIDTPVNKAFVHDYEQKVHAWPTRYGEQGYISAALVLEAIETLRGDVRDRAKLREALRAAIGRIKAPRGAVEFDQYHQMTCDLYVTRVEKGDGRYQNAIIDRIAHVSQEATWGWWRR